jgi:hypothetical protein
MLGSNFVDGIYIKCLIRKAEKKGLLRKTGVNERIILKLI